MAISVAGCGEGSGDTPEHTARTRQALTQRLVFEYWGPLRYGLSVECDPGGGGFPCSTTPGVDAAYYDDFTNGFSVVQANAQPRVTFVNAIGRKLNEGCISDQNGVCVAPIQLTTYQYITAMRLGSPSAMWNAASSGEQTHAEIMFWDGTNQLWNANKHTLEASVFLKLNPWDADYGKWMAYYMDSSGGLALFDTGCRSDPTDTSTWHAVDVRADLLHRVWAGVAIDTCWSSVNGLPLAQIYHPEWGSELALAFTAESENIYPGQNQITRFSTLFRDFKLLTWN
jgi:hypothetical protein